MEDDDEIDFVESSERKATTDDVPVSEREATTDDVPVSEREATTDDVPVVNMIKKCLENDDTSDAISDDSDFENVPSFSPGQLATYI